MSSSTPIVNGDSNLNQITTRRSTRSRQPRLQTQNFRHPPISTHTPKTASEKAIFRRNATESPLLRLPSELRHRIWSLVLGERVVHIRTTPSPLQYESGRKKGEWCILEGRECACPFTEKEIYENYMVCLKALREVEKEIEPEEEFNFQDDGQTILPDFSNFQDDGQTILLDFSTLENPDVLENFDFDSFLNQTSTDNFNTDIFNTDGFSTGAFNGTPFPDYARTDHDGETSYECFSLPSGLDTLEPKHRKRVLLYALQSNPHAACKAMRPGISHRPPRKLSLCLMETCRQIYGEAKAVFWSSNTFSISSGGDFYVFLTEQSAFTRGLITKMQLDFVPAGIHVAWVEAICKTRLVASLRGLRELHLRVTDDSFNNVPRSAEFFLASLKPFCGLGLKVATMVIACWTPSWRMSAWPVDEHIEIIQRVMRSLIDKESLSTI
jgi:hypothetical protein